jgi:hypothetical protein
MPLIACGLLKITYDLMLPTSRCTGAGEELEAAFKFGEIELDRAAAEAGSRTSTTAAPPDRNGG